MIPPNDQKGVNQKIATYESPECPGEAIAQGPANQNFRGKGGNNRRIEKT